MIENKNLNIQEFVDPLIGLWDDNPILWLPFY
jgi:hypothetical protein